MKLEIKHILVGLLLVTASGCSSNETSNQASAEVVSGATNSESANQAVKVDKNTLAKNTEEPKTKNSIGYECKNIVLTGTRIKKKVCSTAAQREASKEKGQDFHRHMQISDSIGEKAG